jgi:hypothetical protein
VQQRQQQEPEREREQRRERERVREQQLLLSCRKQTGQRQQRWRPERETCSFFDSLMNEKNIFHFRQKPELAIQVSRQAR